MKEIDVETARAVVHGHQEVAFLDVREAGQFGEGHALFAVPASYSRLETVVPCLVPRADAKILLIDAGDGVAERAAATLARLGYLDLTVTAGGMPAWAAAGFPVYKGVNVPSKTLGELAEMIWQPAMVKPQTLREWQNSAKSFRLFDARPPEEYAKMRVPSSVCLPNGELAHRLQAVEPDAKHPIVITCAGRTRGIAGAIGLRLAGYQGRVFALENGTQGWALAGFELDRGNAAAPFPPLSPEALEGTKARALTICERFAIPVITAAQVERLFQDRRSTTYLFDVRSREEAVDDPVPAAIHAPSGQLVQATDQWVGVRRARLILADDGGLRAALAAFWLTQLGYEVHVTLIDSTLRRLARTRLMGWQQDDEFTPTAVGAAEALREVGSGRGSFIDIRPSPAYRQEHVEGARWSIRPRILEAAGRNGGRDTYVISEKRENAEHVARDLHAAGFRPVHVVDGGHESLVAAGAQTLSTPGDPPDHEALDFLFFVHDRHDGNLASARRYLAWETGLISELDEAERAQFRLFRP
jgi:rhodanese-related sulfurtransferase